MSFISKRYWLWIPFAFLLVMLTYYHFIAVPELNSCRPIGGGLTSCAEPNYPIFIGKLGFVVIEEINKIIYLFNFTSLNIELPQSYPFIYLLESIILGILIFAAQKLYSRNREVGK